MAFLVSLICFYKCLRGVLLNPTWMAILYKRGGKKARKTPWHERRGLLRVLWTTIISPFGKVQFFQGYVGDILTRHGGS
ncbi:unnamed protein product [Ectocarpus sp. CCAP 1310/34]|nr:unnamed protein product [Ectocarpus sp. CCAP 1310/34]